MRSFWASSRTSCLIICAVVLACVGCSKPPQFHIVAESAFANSDHKYKVILNGQDMGTITGSGNLEFDAQGQKAETIREMLPPLEAQMLFVCGWQKTEFNVNAPGRDEMEQARTEHRGAVVHVMIYEYQPPTAPNAIVNDVTILVDNRGGPEQTITVGELKKSVAAGAVDRVGLPYWPNCDQAKQLRVNGQVVSAIKENPKRAGTALPMLLDTSGSHCYREKWQNYSQDNFSFGPASGQGKTIYRPRPLLVLDEAPNLFLRPLPATVSDYVPYASRTTLAEVACR